MYNSERKEKFIFEFSTSESRRRAATMFFNALEKYECEWGADVCTQNKDAILPVITELSGIRAEVKRLRLQILKTYTKWCIKEGFDDVCDEVFEIKEVGIDKIRQKMVANPQHLQRFLDCVCDKETDDTVDCVNRSFYWFAFAGVPENVVFTLTKEHVDLEEYVVRYGGFEYFLPRESFAAVKRCVTYTEFRYRHPLYADRVIYKDRVEGDNVLRGIGKTNDLQMMRTVMAHKIKNQKYRENFDKDDTSVDIKPSYYKIWLSGVFYRMHEIERGGGVVDFNSLVSYRMEGVEYSLAKSRHTRDFKKRQLVKEYETDYNRWKEAFSI